MKAKAIILIISLIFLAFSFGCIGQETETNETKLEVEEGVGVVGTLKIDELHPGLDGYISLTVRSNLGGEGARNVYISLDNVKPFKLVECGNEISEPSRNRSLDNCNGFLDLDKNLPYRTRGTVKLFPGEELDVFWRLKAPSVNEISDIALKHPIYYDVEYDYHVNFHQSIVFMSQNEMLRRRQAGEEYLIQGESASTAGEIRFKSITQQPILFAFDYQPGSDNPEKDFSFVLSYLVENKGHGFPISDVIVILEYPQDIKPQEDVLNAYGWKEWNKWNGKINVTEYQPGVGAVTKEVNCRTGIGEENCKDWINEIFKDEKINQDRLLVKVIKREDFVESFTINAPMVLKGEVKKELRDRNIPLKIYPFKVYVGYRYFIEGKEYITVYPLRGI